MRLSGLSWVLTAVCVATPVGGCGDDARIGDADATGSDAAMRDATTAEDAQIDAAMDAAIDAGAVDGGDASPGEPSPSGCDRNSWRSFYPELAGCDLSAADLRNVDLSNADLTGADLTDADLGGADLRGANMTGAVLDRSVLAGAKLAKAILDGSHPVELTWCPASLPQRWLCAKADNGSWFLAGPGVDLADADLRGAIVGAVDLSGARLDGTDLSGVDLGFATLGGVHASELRGCPAELPMTWSCASRPGGGPSALLGPQANLRGADLSGYDLQWATLSGADLSDADLRRAHLYGAELDRADLTEADLTGADAAWVNFDAAQLDGAVFAGAVLWSATFVGARLRGADLSGADLEWADLTNADLGEADLSRAHPVPLKGCPRVLPEAWRCVTLDPSGRFVMLGPGVDLREELLGSLDLRGIDLADADLGRSGLYGTDLSGADLTGASLPDELTVRAVDLRGCPATLPADAFCVASMSTGLFALLGPQLDISGANLEGMDLSGFEVAQLLNTDDVASCPAALPADWRCVAHRGGARTLIGPGARIGAVDLSASDLNEARLEGVVFEGTKLAGADLSGADLENAVLREVDLAGVDLAGAVLRDATLESDLTGLDLSSAELQGASFRGAHCPSALPAGWQCAAQPAGTRPLLIGPGARLTGELSNLDLAGLDLSEVTLDAIGAANVLACPAQLPPEWRCVPHAMSGRFALAGPRVQWLSESAVLSGADLHDADLSGALLLRVNLTGANLQGADLSSSYLLGDGFAMADLRSADLTNASIDGSIEGADLSGAVLQGTHTNTRACPSALPTGFGCVPLQNGNYTVAGPGVSLRYQRFGAADLSGIALDAGTDLTALSATELSDCPSALPPAWSCVFQPLTGHHILIGPQAALANARFAGSDLSGLDLSAVDLFGAMTGPLRGCPAALPDSWRCVSIAFGNFALIGPGANLSGIDLQQSTLSGIRADRLAACPLGLPANWMCIATSDGNHALVGPGAQLSNAYFYDADILDTADLQNADLRGANLKGVTLVHANLRGAMLEGAKLAGAVTADTTTCPNGTPGPCSLIP